jgi:hypothetical protein
MLGDCANDFGFEPFAPMRRVWRWRIKINVARLHAIGALEYRKRPGGLLFRKALLRFGSAVPSSPFFEWVFEVAAFLRHFVLGWLGRRLADSAIRAARFHDCHSFRRACRGFIGYDGVIRISNSTNTATLRREAKSSRYTSIDGSSMLWLILWFQGIHLKSYWLIIAARIVCGIVGINVIVLAVLVAFALASTKRGRVSKLNRQT